MSIWKAKDYLKLALYFGAAYWVLTRLGQFTDKQAIILAGIIAVLLNLIASVVKKEEREKFEPFTLTFSPNWQAILIDNGVATIEQLAEAYSIKPKPGFRILLAQFKLTRLSSYLWFFNNYNLFRRKLNISHSLDELLPPDQRETVLAFAPQLYFKETSDKHPKFGLIRCIEFGLVTPESLNRSVHWKDDRSNIPLGRFPDAVFNPYYASENFALNEKVNETEIGILLQHYYWEKEERDFDSPWQAEVFKHKCMTLYLEGIE